LLPVLMSILNNGANETTQVGFSVRQQVLDIMLFKTSFFSDAYGSMLYFKHLDKASDSIG
jgi:hypothetical protein